MINATQLPDATCYFALIENEGLQELLLSSVARHKKIREWHEWGELSECSEYSELDEWNELGEWSE